MQHTNHPEIMMAVLLPKKEIILSKSQLKKTIFGCHMIVFHVESGVLLFINCPSGVQELYILPFFWCPRARISLKVMLTPQQAHRYLDPWDRQTWWVCSGKLTCRHPTAGLRPGRW